MSSNSRNHSHDLKLGVRWNFDQPQPVYQQRVVRKG